MGYEFQIIGLTVEEFKCLLKSVVQECLRESRFSKASNDQALTIQQARKFLNISPPTLRKYVKQGLIRRHNMGPRKKLFYLSELEEDIKNLPTYQG